jgi:hypothetical protein
MRVSMRTVDSNVLLVGGLEPPPRALVGITTFVVAVTTPEPAVPITVAEPKNDRRSAVVTTFSVHPIS